MLGHLSLIAAALLALAIDEPKKDVTREQLAALQGTWVMVAHEVNGAPDDAMKGAIRVVTGDTFTIRKGDKVMHAATLKLDPTKSPAWIDITFTEGPDKGKARHGIYTLEGDTQRICYSDLDGERPKEFASKAGSNHRLVVFERSKP